MEGHEARQQIRIYWNFCPCCIDFLVSLGLLLGTVAVIPDWTVGTGSLTPDSTAGTGPVIPDTLAETGSVSIDVTAGTGPVSLDNLAVNFCIAGSHQRLGTGCLCCNYKSAAIVGALVILHFVWLFGTDQPAGTAQQLLGTAV